MSSRSFNKKLHSAVHSKWSPFVAVPLAIILNILLSILSMDVLHLPFFMDSIWTFVASAWFGVVPGVLAGFFYNIVSGALRGAIKFDWLFGFIGIFNALAVVFFIRKKGWPDSIFLLIFLCFIFAVMNAFLGTIISFFVFSDIIALPEPTDSVIRLFMSCGNNIVFASFVSRFFINFIDKGIALLITVPLYHWYTHSPDENKKVLSEE